MRTVLYDVEWQLLRINLLQVNRNDGGWTTTEGQAENFRKLEDYITAVDMNSDEYHVRMWRVHNCMNAVVMGYNGQGASSELITRVQRWRKAWTSDYDTIAVTYQANKWDWKKVEEDLLKVDNMYLFHMLYSDLHRRSQRGSQETRPDLHKFLELMLSASKTFRKSSRLTS